MEPPVEQECHGVVHYSLLAFGEDPVTLRDTDILLQIHQKKIRDVNKLPMRLDNIITRKVGDFGIVTRAGRVGRVRHPPNSLHFFLITSSRSRLPSAIVNIFFTSLKSQHFIFILIATGFLRPVTRIAVTVRRKDPVEGQGKTRPSYLDIHSACQVPESFDVRGLLGPRP